MYIAWRNLTMNSKSIRQAERGEAHSVIIICLVVALVVALGWIFWQNFSNEKSEVTDKQDTSTAARSAEDDAAELDKTDNTLKLSELGVVVPLGDDDAYDFSAKYENNGYFIYSASVSKLCGSEASVGAISKWNPADDGTGPSSAAYNQVGAVTIGGAKYLFISPQSACADPATAQGDQANEMQGEASRAFGELFKNARAQ